MRAKVHAYALKTSWQRVELNSKWMPMPLFSYYRYCRSYVTLALLRYPYWNVAIFICWQIWMRHARHAIKNVESVFVQRIYANYILVFDMQKNTECCFSLSTCHIFYIVVHGCLEQLLCSISFRQVTFGLGKFLERVDHPCWFALWLDTLDESVAQ